MRKQCEKAALNGLPFFHSVPVAFFTLVQPTIIALYFFPQISLISFLCYSHPYSKPPSPTFSLPQETLSLSPTFFKPHLTDFKHINFFLSLGKLQLLPFMRHQSHFALLLLPLQHLTLHRHVLLTTGSLWSFCPFVCLLVGISSCL